MMSWSNRSRNKTNLQSPQATGQIILAVCWTFRRLTTGFIVNLSTWHVLVQNGNLSATVPRLAIEHDVGVVVATMQTGKVKMSPQRRWSWFWTLACIRWTRQTKTVPMNQTFQKQCYIKSVVSFSLRHIFLSFNDMRDWTDILFESCWCTY